MEWHLGSGACQLGHVKGALRAVAAGEATACASVCLCVCVCVCASVCVQSITGEQKMSIKRLRL